MLYRLLGIAVWKAGKYFLHRELGRTPVPKPLLAGAGLALAGGVVLLILRHNSSEG